jgi:ribosome-binding protein aMBF1 (putative translation factor)
MKNEKYAPVLLDIEASLMAAQKRPGFTEAWDALEEEYQTLSALLKARRDAGLTQEALAEKMGTTKSAVSRLEASLRDQKHSPSFVTLKKYANACGKKLVIQLV